jgi:1,2-diacylglycerol 3-beta-galactosyltransferase
MNQLMQAADLIVTKAGPGTIVEALNSHLPLVLYSRLSGQEDGNVSFVTDHGAGLWQPKITELAATIQAILDDPLALTHMTAAAATIAQNGANAKIATAIGDLLGI